MTFLYILLILLSSYSTLNGLHVQLHAISRCASTACESGVGIYPHCTECNKFIYCIFGYAVERSCPENLVFDINYGICNLPNNAKCWDSNINNQQDATLEIDDASEEWNRQYSINPDFPETLKESIKDVKKQQPEVTLNTDDPPKEWNTNLPKKSDDSNDGAKEEEPEVTLNTDDPPEEWNTKLPKKSDDSNDGAKEEEPEVTLNTDDPPEEWNTNLPKKSDDSNDGAKEEEPEVTLNTDNPPEEWNTNLPNKSDDSNDGAKEQQPEVTLNTDDPPEEWNTDFPDNPNDKVKEHKVTMNTDDPPIEMNAYSHGKSEEDIPSKDKSSGNVDSRAAAPPNQDAFTRNGFGKDHLSNQQADPPKVKVPCVRDCNGMPEGSYQSCDGCTSFVSCMWGMRLDNTCFSGLFWDDISKKCISKSTTC